MRVTGNIATAVVDMIEMRKLFPGQLGSKERMVDRYKSLWDGPKTVADFIELLSAFPGDWPIRVSTQAGGGIGVEHRELSGKPLVAIFGKNGGRFGENPLTEEEYQRQSESFVNDLARGCRYTSIHGDHRTYSPDMGDQATCYGTHYDRRIIERMVSEGRITFSSDDIARVAYLDK